MNKIQEEILKCATLRGQTVDEMIEDFRQSVGPDYAEAIKKTWETGAPHGKEKS